MYKIIQLTDCHLLKEPNAELLGVNTNKSFEECLAVAKAMKPDLLILSGDISEDGSVESYQRIKIYLDQSSLEYVVLPGNHDSIPNLKAVFKVKCYLDQNLEVNGWNILLLNSVVPSEIYGSLNINSFELIRKSLKKDLPIAIFLHHHPKKLGSPLMDKYVLDNPDEFVNALKDSDGLIKFICCGHVHQEHESQINEIAFITTPSTCMQFKPGMKELEIDDLPPGMRLFELKNDGNFVSKVIRLK